ncbi:hypothetical protein EYF80_060292 [Liparis tanakae]|uniref:Uncharacterized protein n=1 Tax=Liparis tanakae TaxID=230148 RepID=A0A4Z2EL82_9TELE|nr:hypothetical protein EYF80_060292 [Liparis tanakae]
MADAQINPAELYTLTSRIRHDPRPWLFDGAPPTTKVDLRVALQFKETVNLWTRRRSNPPQRRRDISQEEVVRIHPPGSMNIIRRDETTQFRY